MLLMLSKRQRLVVCYCKKSPSKPARFTLRPTRLVRHAARAQAFALEHLIPKIYHQAHSFFCPLHLRSRACDTSPATTTKIAFHVALPPSDAGRKIALARDKAVFAEFCFMNWCTPTTTRKAATNAMTKMCQRSLATRKKCAQLSLKIALRLNSTHFRLLSRIPYSSNGTAGNYPTLKSIKQPTQKR